MRLIEKQITWYRSVERLIACKSEKEALEPFAKMTELYRGAMRLKQNNPNRDKKSKELLQIRELVNGDLDEEHDYLVQFTRQLQYRVRSGENREMHPLLDTFDLLANQNIELKTKLIRVTSGGAKQGRNLTTNKTRRGGKKGRAQKRREHGLIGTLVHHQLRDAELDGMDRDDLTYELTESPFKEPYDMKNYDKHRPGPKPDFDKIGEFLGDKEKKNYQSGTTQFLPRRIYGKQAPANLALSVFAPQSKQQDKRRTMALD